MATFDRFDICEAYGVYAALWGGDGCAYENKIGVRLSRLGFSPGASRNAGTIASLSANGREIYAALVERRQHTTSGYVQCACCAADCMGTLVIGRRGQVPIGSDLCLECEEHECEIGADDCQVPCDACGAAGCGGSCDLDDDDDDDEHDEHDEHDEPDTDNGEV